MKKISTVASMLFLLVNVTASAQTTPVKSLEFEIVRTSEQKYKIAIAIIEVIKFVTCFSCFSNKKLMEKYEKNKINKQRANQPIACAEIKSYFWKHSPFLYSI